jgi:hypothetical protein
MSDIPFYRTQMGYRFYEATAPSLVRELARLNENFERLLTIIERHANLENAEPTKAKPEEPR